MNTQYPYWKIVAWRFVRGAIWGGVANLATVSTVLSPDLSNYRMYVGAVATAFIAGAGNAAFMVLRDALSEGDKSATVQKLPL